MPNDYDEIEKVLRDYRTVIERLYAPSREKALALTKLDECYLWLREARKVSPLSARSQTTVDALTT